MQDGHKGIRQLAALGNASTVFAEVRDELLRVVHAEYLAEVRHFNNKRINGRIL
jgi:hypothetical protein